MTDEKPILKIIPPDVDGWRKLKDGLEREIDSLKRTLEMNEYVYPFVVKKLTEAEERAK